MRQTNVRGSLSLRGFRKLRTGAIVATGVILLGLGFSAPTASVSEQDGVWVARTVAEVKADIQKEGDLFKYVIKWGDTLSVISEASNIPVDVLQEMNQASGKNLFLPYNELYFTEAETVSDTVTKHKIVIKESGASGEVRTYEVLLKKDQETKAVTFELTDVTEKVEKMTVNYSPVYQPVSVPVVERAEESVEEPALVAPAVTSPEVKEETEAPVAPKAEEVATTPAPKAEEPEADSTTSGKSGNTTEEAVTPAPAGEEGKSEPTESAPKVEEPEVAKPATPKAEEKEEAPVDGTTSNEVGNADETSVEETGKQDSITNVPSEESSESSSAGTDSTSEAEELATTETASTSTNEDTNEGESEKPVAEETTVTEGQPATDSTDSSSATSNSADSSPSTESTAPEETLATTGNTSNSSTDVTTSADSGDSTPSTLTSDETKPEEVASEAEGKEPKVEGQPSGTESATPEQSTNIEETTEKQSGDTSENSGDSLVSDEPAESSGISTSSGTEGAETIDTETTSDKSETPSPAEESVKEEKQVDKKLELRNISSVELYSKEGGKYRHVPSLDSLPSNPETYFMKVKSENFKDVMLPVKTITNDTKDNRAVYKIVASANNLIQHENSNVLENYTYYLPKTQQSETGVYTSFKNLVDAMNSNPYGEFRLGATMDAREVELSDGQESYVKNEFHGKLVGTNNEKYYAIYNLKKPLFGGLNGATVEKLSLKDVNILAKEDAATLAKEANSNTHIDNVHADGAIAGEHGIGGLVSQVNNSTISNSSYTGRITNTYNTVASYQIGGLVGKLSGSRGLIDKSFASIDLASNATKGDQSIGGIVGAVEDSALISNSYAEGNLNNVQRFANVGGVVGNLWDPVGGLEKSGRLSNVLSDVNVTNGNAITGKDFTNMQASHVYSNKNNKVVNVVQEDDEILTKDSDVQRGEVLEDAQIKEKKAVFASKNTIKTEDFNFSSRYVTDYKNLENAVSSKEKVYKNIEKLLPFYNRETIVKYGNLVESNSNLYTKELLSVVPMKDKEVISDINKYKSSINKLLLNYSDNTSEKLNVNYQSDFSNVAEYRIDGTNLIYTPNTLLRNYKNILDEVLPALNSVEYKSETIRKVLDVSKDVSLTELYLEEQFKTTKRDLRDSLTKLLTADAAIVENNNKIIDNYVIEKIKNNKEALLLGLTYLERWYNFKYGETKAKDLVMYHLDFFGKSNSSALDNVIELGKSGYNNLLAKNNVITYNVLLAKNYKTNNLFDALEKYRKVFVPDKTNNEWFKEQTKAYIVEEKSTIKEVSDKQSIAGSPQSIGVYDRLTSPSWKYQSMVLPLLTLPEEKTIFMIANISTIGFGAYDRYRSKEHPKGDKLNKFVEDNVQAAAKRFRDHYDYWYKILDDKNKEKLYRSVLVYDAFRFGTDEREDKKTYQANFETDHPAIKHFFGPAGNNVVHNSNGAYATGDAFYYMAYRMLDKDGAVTYTHEMTHNSDREIYLGGYGRRNGLGPEFYAKGLLQAPDHPYDPTITINSILKYEESENPTRLQVKDPTERFKNAEDLQKYMHNLFDVIYMLEYLEGNAVVNLDISKKNELLRKIENKFETDPDGSNVYATNVIRYLNESELNKLNSFESLIENDVITRRGYENGNDNTFKRNGYYTIKLFSPIYSALSNNKGTPGDLMGRRMAFELLAAKGFKDGMVPYISNQYAEEAKENGHVITSYGKVIGNVTDELVLEKVFNNRYSSWVEFKKAMYEERKAKFNNLISISFYNPNQRLSRDSKVTITNIDMLRKMITEAVKADAEDDLAKMYLEQSRVHKLKQAIFKAYLDQTNDFRSSIFDEEK
ncbi:ZmpA/ZmpB/ZmpC family metallo-endopeptidase [Streptococcus pseudopneumoniae]|uniref:ZmpA/ZmpB/ZmpC family metallo-endopeptidase n=1 Tax=Streptococcus pseudopneumoniae TaxID=257758 RepID=UPI0018B095EB|nr:ZmpA/ZmpB/ZmpC family metallo-endopeptidase [Streptococcus pseudopneumoniae]MBF9650001.1 peptidase M26 [Streptococcus pseudopneumoniae]